MTATRAEAIATAEHEYASALHRWRAARDAQVMARNDLTAATDVVDAAVERVGMAQTALLVLIADGDRPRPLSS